ncbi:DUF6255 family natural product biosynthesis protein [Streptomyces sp. NPDC050617]|uniref:DUF6255 family natural product biosynthesis protein n=1 Tax=Streptomyces sp. NPDC050617 TaxID=3154628 RepID=UPI0034324FBD
MRRTETAWGYAASSCAHAKGWHEHNGMNRCSACGTERAESYEPLRLPPYAPDGTRPDGTDQARGHRMTFGDVPRQPSPNAP